IASHSGCALRPRAASALTSSADIAGTVVMTSPVAGYSTGMPAEPLVDAAAGLDSTVAIASPSLARGLEAYFMLAGQPVAGSSELVEDPRALGVVLGRGDHPVVAQLVELAQALGDRGGRRRPTVGGWGRGRRRGRGRGLRGGGGPRRRR